MANFLIEAGIFLLIFHFSNGLIPKLCAVNATLISAMCCPIPTDLSEPCGGRQRGICEAIVLDRNDKENINIKNTNVENDDRINWPTRFFQFTCQCRNNYAGIACEYCKFGWTGETCNIQAEKKIRKNVFDLSDFEKFVFRYVLNASKYQSSDYLILNTSSSDNCDPATPETLQFANASIYDAMVYLHFYSSRSTLNKDKMDICSANDSLLDFAHKGPSFFTWHRYYLLMFEELLARIAIQQLHITNFTLPYWDWINETSCTVCVDDLVGPIPFPSPDSNSSFDKWRPMCPQNSLDSACHVCDPFEEQPFLWRQYSTNVPRLPNQEEVDALISIASYDDPPFDSNAYSGKSFRNFAEGFIRLDPNKFDPKMENINKLSANKNVFMHNMVHSFINGTWLDVTTSPNDPLFLLHHTFMDKIFEMWLLKNPQAAIPANDSFPIGHNPEDNLVPFIPIVKSRTMFIRAAEFGYNYDDNYLGTNLIRDSSEEIYQNSNLIYYLIAAILVLGLSMIVSCLCCAFSKKFRKSYQPPIVDEYDTEKQSAYPYNDETTPLLKY